MADEDEIDILGEFSLDNLFTKSEPSNFNAAITQRNSELLNCDYNINSQWLLENSGANWYGSTSETGLGFEETALFPKEPHIVPPTIWTDKEKSLLQRGLEIFDKHPGRLSQFIGTKTPAEVKQYLKNNPIDIFVQSDDLISNVVDTQDIGADIVIPQTSFNDDLVPGSIEDAITSVTTGKPTVMVLSSNNKRLKKQTGPKLKKTKTKQIAAESWLLDQCKIIKKQRFIKNVNQFIEAPIPVKQEKQEQKPNSAEENSESDIEVDIENDDSETSTLFVSPIITRQDEKKDSVVDTRLPIEHGKKESKIQSIDFLKELDDETYHFVTNNVYPHEEAKIDLDKYSHIEKLFNYEFFEGKPSKTPSRYMKIRNHIINAWNNCKPSYLTKTYVRNGLKNCGDVNSIGRVHTFLEQIGVINFGCEQTTYTRPLYLILIQIQNHTSPKEKPPKKETKPELFRQNRAEIVRSRAKKKFDNDGSGGYTMVHNEHGEVVDVTVVNREPLKPKQPPKKASPITELVPCSSFDVAPYSVNLHISALLLMDIHAHSALTEVMGLLGGLFDSESGILTIAKYVPCKTLDHGITHCDMCPISQSEANETIRQNGLEVVGWFHSHPTFPPNPSLQDMDTQLSMQSYWSTGPFVGIILSPFTNTLASSYRCLVVENKESKITPFKFIVNVYSDKMNLSDLMWSASKILTNKNDTLTARYFKDTTLTYIDKLLSSMKHHMTNANLKDEITNAVLSTVASFVL